jgi:6-phosphogluconolactonase
MTRPDRRRARVEVVADSAALARRGAELVLERLSAAIEGRGRASWALSGGATPNGLYGRLAREARSRLDWTRVALFWGDERTVPPDDPGSNFGAARATGLLDLVPPDRVHRWPTELGPEAAASAYEETLRRELAAGAGEPPRFDLVLLGLGEDGHTASLFPGSPALAERMRLAVANPVSALATTRLTLTLPVLDAARTVLFLAAGTEKAAAVAGVFGPEGPDPDLPAARVDPRPGELHVLLDRAAAARLAPAGSRSA